MNIISYHYKLFKRLYSKEIRTYTLIFIFHICRKTIFNNANDGGASGQLLMILCIVLNLYIVFKEKRILKQALFNNGMYLAYFALAIFTILTTQIAGAMTSILPKAVEVISSFMALAVVYWRIGNKRLAMIYLLYLTTIATALGYISYALAYGSLWAHTNTYSFTAAIGILLCLSMRRYEKEINFKYFLIFNFGALILGTSSASFIAFAAGFLMYWSSSIRGINFGKACLVLLAVLCVYYFGMDMIYDIFFYGRSEEKIQNGSGRESIWEACFAAWRESPWFGQGYIVGERNLTIWGSGVDALSAHNGYMSILVNTGIIGCVIYGTYLLRTIWMCWENISSKYIGKEMTTLFIVLFCVLVNNYAYPCFGSDWNFTLIPVTSIFILINTMQYKKCG